MYDFLHFVDVERFVQNFLGCFTVLGSDQSYCYNLCTRMLLASILTTFGTHLFSHHVLEAAANCFIERLKRNCISGDIRIDNFLGDGTLLVSIKM